MCLFLKRHRERQRVCVVHLLDVSFSGNNLAPYAKSISKAFHCAALTPPIAVFPGLSRESGLRKRVANFFEVVFAPLARGRRCSGPACARSSHRTARYPRTRCSKQNRAVRRRAQPRLVTLASQTAYQWHAAHKTAIISACGRQRYDG